MVYLLNMVIFHSYVSHNQMVCFPEDSYLVDCPLRGEPCTGRLNDGVGQGGTRIYCVELPILLLKSTSLLLKSTFLLVKSTSFLFKSLVYPLVN